MSSTPLPSSVNTPDVSAWMRGALIVGGIGIVICLIGGLMDRVHFFRSWLVAFNVVLGVAAGSLVVVMMQYLVGGNWAFAIRRPLEAATRTLPLVTLLFIPIMFGLWNLYTWADPNILHEDKLLQKKVPYLNWQFFLIRAAIYFAIWNVLMFLLNRWSKQQDTAKSPQITERCASLSAPGILLYAITITFASIDWVMSLEPHWYSTIFMAIFGMGQVLSGFVFCVAFLLLISLREPPAPAAHASGASGHTEGIQTTVGTSTTQPSPGVLQPQTISDLGSLMLAFVMVWAYLSLCQFLLIYSGNLPVEVEYYTRRGLGPQQWNLWTFVALSLVLLHFTLPFFLLLSRDIKRDRRRLAAVALLLLVMRVVEMFWVVVPAFDHTHYPPGIGVLLYPAALVGVGGLWLAYYLWQVQKLPLLPAYNPEEAGHG